MRTIATKLSDQILFSTYRQLFPGWCTVTSRAMATRFWDGKKFVVIKSAEDYGELEKIDRDKSKEEIESEKILKMLGDDDYRVSPKPVIQGPPRGMKYRKKYLKTLDNQVKADEKFSMERIEKMLNKMVLAQQPYRKAPEMGKDRINDEFALIRTKKPPNPYQSKQRKCIICEYDVHLDYKNVRLLSQFVSPHTGMIYHRGVTGMCIPMQKHIASLIKTARMFGFMPYANKTFEFKEDPDIRPKEN